MLRSIKSVVVFFFIAAMLVSILLIGVVSLTVGSNLIEQEVQDSLTSLAKEAAEIIDSRIETQNKMLEIIASIEDIKSMDIQKQKAVLAEQIVHTNFLALAIVYPNGEAFYSDGTTAQLGDRDYVQKAFQGETNISDVIISRVTNTSVLMYAAPIKKDGKVVGALIGRRDASTMSDLASSITYGTTGYAFIINGKGTITAHKNYDLVMDQVNYVELAKTDKEFVELASLMKDEMIAGKTGHGYYTYLGDKKLMGFAPVKGEDMFIAVTAEQKDILTGASNLRVTIIILALVLLGIGGAVSFLIGNRVANPIKQAAKIVENLAEGDIDFEIDSNLSNEAQEIMIPIQQLVDNTRKQVYLAERIAEGDLTVDVHVRSEKDVLNIKFKEIVDKNNVVLSNIVQAAHQVTVGSGQVSDSSISLSQGSAEQASSVEELTASLEEVSSQTDVNANNANEANQLAESAKNNAVEGNNKMHEMVEAMQEISDSSENISKVIKVIDDIAFQTNILALNAAVEAARAGQHGKGFAVVAEEVRNLAARSADAAKETADMIENSIKKSDGGTRIANETAQALNKIVDEVTKAANLVRDIAVASNEQASAIGQINQGILQVSQVVQSNAATSEETAAASEELSSQADLLQEMVAQFRLRSDAGTNLDSGYAMGNSNKKGISQDMFESLGSLKKDDKKQTDNAKAAITSGGFGKY